MHCYNPKIAILGQFYQFASDAKQISICERCKRIVAAVQSKMQWRTCLLVLFAFQPAYAQIGSGSVVVFELINKKFTVAADSRVTLNGVRSDTYCKILAFRQQMVFAAVGNVVYIPGRIDISPRWSATEEARKAVEALASGSSHSSIVEVTQIAELWANNMESNWQFLSLSHRELVRKLAKRGGGLLTVGIFAAAVDGNITLTERAIILRDDSPTIALFPQMGRCIFGPCAIGMTGVFAKYTGFDAGLERIITPSPSLAKRLSATAIQNHKTHRSHNCLRTIRRGWR